MSNPERPPHTQRADFFPPFVAWERRDIVKELCSAAEWRMSDAIETETAMLLRFPQTAFDLDDEQVPYTMITKFYGVPVCLTTQPVQTLTEIIPEGMWVLPDPATTQRIATAFDDDEIRIDLVGSIGSYTVLRPMLPYDPTRRRLDPQDVQRYFQSAPSRARTSFVSDYHRPNLYISRTALRDRYTERIPA
jgi:hypothetical protein